MADELVVAARLRARPAARLRPRRLLPRAVDEAAGQGGRHRRGVGGGHRDAAHGRGRAKDLELVLDEGGGAFYGPKISRAGAATRSAAPGRCRRSSSTSRLPQRFDLQYVGADNERHRPIMIHRALFGSVERFFAVLVEHYAGAFPAWLAPVQARAAGAPTATTRTRTSVVDRAAAPRASAPRCVDGASGALGKRIRKAKTEKVPYVLVVGDDRRRERHRRRERGAGATDPSATCPSTTFVERTRRRGRRAPRDAAARDDPRTAVGGLAHRATSSDREHRAYRHGCVDAALCVRRRPTTSEALVLERTDTRSR